MMVKTLNGTGGTARLSIEIGLVEGRDGSGLRLELR